MSVALYMDENVHAAITAGLRDRGIDVLTAQEDVHHETADVIILDRALFLNRLLFTGDDDFLVEASRRQVAGEPFAGVVYAHQAHVSIRACIDDLETIAKAATDVDVKDQVFFLPL